MDELIWASASSLAGMIRERRVTTSADPLYLASHWWRSSRSRRKRSLTSRKAQPCESTCSGSYRDDLFQNALPDAGFERSLHDEVYLHAKKFGQVAP